MGLRRRKKQEQPVAVPARQIEFVSRFDPAEPRTYGIYAAVEDGKELVADVEAWKAENGIDSGLLSEAVLEQIAAAFPE